MAARMFDYAELLHPDLPPAARDRDVTQINGQAAHWNDQHESQEQDAHRQTGQIAQARVGGKFPAEKLSQPPVATAMNTQTWHSSPRHQNGSSGKRTATSEPCGVSRRNAPPAAITNRLTRVTYGPCKDKLEIVLWRLTGAGHVWPGGASDCLDRMLGSQSKILGPLTDVIDANTQIWQFESRYHSSFIRQVPD
jgi:hypothetical protein